MSGIFFFTEVHKLGTFPHMQYPNTSLYHITSCDGGWTPFPAHKYGMEHPNAGKCYRHHTQKTYYHKIEKRSTHHHPPPNGRWTWTDARAYCRAFQKADSDLASIQDWRTNDFVTRLAPGTMFWIGARWVGSWQWTDGRQWHYTNWAPGHPTMIGTAFVAIGENGVWRDYGNNGPPSQGVPGIMCQYTGGEVTRGT